MGPRRRNTVFGNLPPTLASRSRNGFVGGIGRSEEDVQWLATASCAEALMKNMESEVTPQGQVAVPADILAKLGLTSGAKIEWCERGEEVVVRRATKYSSRDIHDALFASATSPPTPPQPRTLEEMDAGIRALMQRKHARR